MLSPNPAFFLNRFDINDNAFFVGNFGKSDVQNFVQFGVMKLQLSIQRNYKIFYFQVFPKDRGAFRTHSKSKMELFEKIVNSLMPLNIIAKCSILDV